jgi:hypothetical protein
MSAAEPEPASDAPRPGQVGMVMLVGGALLNTAYLVVGNDYSVFMDASWFPWMTETWRAVVRPNHDLLIGLLILFEAAVGVLILSGGAHDAARACLCDRVPSRTMRDGLGGHAVRARHAGGAGAAPAS